MAKSDPSTKNVAARVFVIQFQDPAEPGATGFAGRAEHLMSGENTYFETPEGLVRFLERVMHQLKPRSQRIM